MAVVQVDVDQLETMLVGMIRQAIQDEMLKLKLSLLPMVSDREMEIINKDLGSPDTYEEEFEK